MTAPRPRLVSSLRWRLSTAISGAILLCTVACIAAAVLFLQHRLTDQATADLRRTLYGVPQYVHSQQSDLIGQAQLIAADPAVKDGLVRGNDQALAEYLTRYFADLNIDVLDVIDLRGRSLVREEDLTAPISDLRWLPTVEAALDLGRAGFALEGDTVTRHRIADYALRATVPVHDGTDIIGAVVVGRKLNTAFAERISRALGTQVNLIVQDQRTGTTVAGQSRLPINGVPESNAKLARIAANRISITKVSSSGKTSLSGIVPLPGNDGRPAGAIEVVSALNPIYDLIKQLSLLLITLGATVVVVGTLFALDISRRLTSRLQILETTASHVARMATVDAPMHDMRGVVDVGGSDEVASLAHSFDSMMGALDQRMEANARLYAAAQARVRELSGLAEIARLLTAGPSIRDTLHLLGERVCALVGCPAVAIWLPGEGNLPPLHGGHGLPDFYEELMTLALQESPDRDVQMTSQRTFIDGSISWSRLEEPPATLPAAHTALLNAARKEGLQSATAVPLRVGDSIVGVLTCYSQSAEPMTESDLGLLTTIADQVAVAVENARLYRQSRDLATLQERARLARDLHDSVTQALFSMTMHARAAQMALQREHVNSDSMATKSIKQLHELTQGALAEMRALIFELRPGALAEEGLAEALRKQATVLAVREHLKVEVDAPSERIVLEEQQEEHLYRLALEALHNIAKHARASHVRVALQCRHVGNELTLEIADDGIGFDPTAVPAGHFGLNTMEERAHLMGAGFTVDTSPGRGTTIRVSLASASAGSSGGQALYQDRIAQ